MIKVSEIERLGGYRLRFHFSDGSSGAFDFHDEVMHSGPMVEPLRDMNYFARVFIDDGAPTWPNGFDMAPDWLRHEIEAAGALERATAGAVE